MNIVKNEAESINLSGFHLNLSPKSKELFFVKYLLFCEAAALRVFLTEKVRNEELLREFERLVFGSKPTEFAATKLASIKRAMKSLDELFIQKKELTWSRDWLLDIGYDETNPATLTLFALTMGNFTKALRDLVQKLNQLASE